MHMLFSLAQISTPLYTWQGGPCYVAKNGCMTPAGFHIDLTSLTFITYGCNQKTCLEAACMFTKSWPLTDLKVRPANSTGHQSIREGSAVPYKRSW